MCWCTRTQEAAWPRAAGRGLRHRGGVLRGPIQNPANGLRRILLLGNSVHKRRRGFIVDSSSPATLIRSCRMKRQLAELPWKVRREKMARDIDPDSGRPFIKINHPAPGDMVRNP